MQQVWRKKSPLFHGNSDVFKNALGGYKPKEKAEFSSTYQATEVRQVVGGREVLYYNAFKNIYRVDGQDVLNQMRKNIGA